MCSARNARHLPPRGLGPRGRRATAPAWPLNNEGRHDQSPDDQGGSAPERMGERANADRPDNPDRPDGGLRPGPGRRRQIGPDDRMTTILPPVVDDRSARRSDPIDEVKAALDGPSQPRDPIDEVKAALDSRATS